MKKQRIIIAAITLVLLAACQDDDGGNLRFPTSLNVFHGVNEAPAVHVDYFEEEIALSDNRALGFGRNLKVSLPSDIERMITFVSAEDTTTVLLRETVSFGEGEIHSLFLTGSGENIEPVIFQDFPLSFATDSIMGIRFVNLSPDSGMVTVSREGEMVAISNDLDFKMASDFNEFSATREAGVYTFEFRDANGELLASTNFDPLPLPRFSFDRPQQRVFRNITFVLVGMRDDGTGTSTLSVRMVDNF